MLQAMASHKAGKTADAIAKAQQALEIARGENDPLAVATVSSALGVIYLEVEDFFRAREVITSAAEVYEADPRLGPEHEFTA